MTERVRSLSIGFALVDEKISNPQVHLPQHLREIEDIDKFLATQPDVITTAGGSIANVVSTYAHFITEGGVRLFYSIGDDNRGVIFQDQTSPKLGEPQIDWQNPTGTCLFVIGEGGEPLDEITYYGAAESVLVSKSEVTDEKNDLFIANVNALRREHVFNQAEFILRTLQNDGGVFTLRLSGAHSIFVEKEDLISFFTSLKNAPDIIFANRDELLYTTGGAKVEEALQSAFPNSRLLVVTLGENGSLVRFEDTIMLIPPASVPKEKIVDVIGAGDSYMGVMLASLFSLPYPRWTQEHVTACAQVGTYAASLVIQSRSSRLSDPEIAQTRMFFNSLSSKQG